MNLRHTLELSLARERLRLLIDDVNECYREIDAILHKATGADNGLGHREGLAGNDGVRERADVARLVRDGRERFRGLK